LNLRAVADELLSALLAPPCAICGAVLEQPLAGAVCECCWRTVHITSASFSLSSIAQARAVGPYESTLRALIHALKYDGRRSVAYGLSRLMAVHGYPILDGADFVVPVPLHHQRLRERGFNQAADLARGLGLPVHHSLTRVRATPSQVELPAEKRRENVRDAFRLRGRSFGALIARTEATLADRIIVLVDDVATTGATLDACARVMRQAGVKEVRALTAARVAT
jgi:ComF family protein